MLRIGSRGNDVKLLQQFLGITADGDFGPQTDRAVRQWQRDNSLLADGIVGPVTRRAMQLDTFATTDNQETVIETDSELHINTHFLPANEYIAGPTDKLYVFGHHTAGWNNPYRTIDNWAGDNRGAVATEFVLGGQRITDNNAEFDGVVVQAFPAGAYGWHLGVGRRKVHTQSVGIELNNFGYLTKGGYSTRVNGRTTWIAKNPDRFYTYVGTEAHPDQVCDLGKPFRGHRYWHNYSDKQIDAFRDLLVFIANRDNIDISKGLPELIKDRGAFEAFDFCDVSYVEARPGFWMHTNVIRGKTDMYPHPAVVEMIQKL